MSNITKTLNQIMESNINIKSIESTLRERFNVINVTETEIYIKPERKENKDSLINRIRDLIFTTSGLNINPDFYVKIYKTTSEIVVRIKRIKRNSR